MTDVTVFGNYLESPGNIDITCEVLASYHLNDFLSLTFQGYLIYDHDIKIPRYEADGMTPIYLTRRDNQLDPTTGDNHYFIDYNDYQNNPTNYNYNLDYVSSGIEDGLLDPGDYEGYKVIKTGAALQFMEYWMLGLSFSF